MRRSSRLRAKKRVNYGEDSLWEKATNMTMDAWNALVEVAADDPEPVPRDPRKPKKKSLFYQKKIQKQKLPPKIKSKPKFRKK